MVCVDTDGEGAQEVGAHQPFWEDIVVPAQEYQEKQGRLVLLKQPQVFEVVVHHCRFGLCDAVSGKPRKQAANLQVNKQEVAELLQQGAQCQHAPGEHQPVEGRAKI